MCRAQIGPLTTVTEVLATAVGASALLCSVAMGIWGLAHGSSRAGLEADALVAGYVGGGLGALLAGVDVLLRYL